MSQTELFPKSQDERIHPMPVGFTLWEEYISRAEEEELLDHVERGIWDTSWKRRVQRYGTGYGPERQRAVAGPLPEWIQDLARRVSKDGQFDRLPDSCVINEYEPGQGIAPHRDYSMFGPKVACVSLGSDIMLDFSLETGRLRQSIFVPARSLWVIEGEARSKWLHGIAARLYDVANGTRHQRGRRVSITFRTAK
jgi:alkylated DNA repair dioxygenase AlkB